MTLITRNPLAAAAVAKLRLPHPYLTTYYAVPSKETSEGARVLHINLEALEHQKTRGKELPAPLHRENLCYTELKDSSEPLPVSSNNSAWARSRRAPTSTIRWDGEAPTLGQLWLIVYMILTQTPTTELFRLKLRGEDTQSVAHQLTQSTLAVPHPSPDSDREESQSKDGSDELIILRSTFWQGAASPIGMRSAWIPSLGGQVNVSTSDFAMTTRFPSTKVHAWHPRRSSKPTPGATIYSRYIPALDEHFSMVALDYQSSEHLDLFHTWQNDPRVAQGWNETGDMEHHRTYLRNLHEDPHVLTVLAYFEDVPFAYFELYWSAVSQMCPDYTNLTRETGRPSRCSLRRSPIRPGTPCSCWQFSSEQPLLFHRISNTDEP
jgi:N5-hydroxy-L-ornithine N5-transacylase